MITLSHQPFSAFEIQEPSLPLAPEIPAEVSEPDWHSLYDSEIPDCPVGWMPPQKARLAFRWVLPARTVIGQHLSLLTTT